MPKQNFGFQKRQKELARERKKQEKAQKKLERANEASRNQADGGVNPEVPSSEPVPPAE